MQSDTFSDYGTRQDNLSVEKTPNDKEEYTEGKHWLLSVELGRGAYGSCHLAIEPHSAEKVFCVKKVCNMKIYLTSCNHAK